MLLTINWSCSDRERLNPFDPQNPVTKGAPAGLTVTSHRKTVTLKWNPVEVNDLIGYNIYRTLGVGLSELYHLVPAPPEAFSDLSVQYDSTYSYAVQTVTAFDSSTLSEPVVITPGPVNIWIADYYAMIVKRLTYDGAHILGTLQLASPIAIVVDTVHNQAIVADYWGQRLFFLDLDLQLSSEISLEYPPVTLALDNTSGRIYALLQAENGSIRVYESNGDSSATIPFPQEVSINTSIAYDPVGNSLWITGRNAVYQYRFQGQTGYTLQVGLAVSGAIVADPIAGGCWVSVDSGIVKLSLSGEQIVVKSGFSPYDISVNPVNGDCYYTGFQYDTGDWQTGRISAAGDFTDTVILDDKFPDLYRLQALPAAGRAGFIAIQVYTWKLLRFDADGTLIGELDSINGRLDFALE